MSFTHALKWSFASELAAKAIQPVAFVILARLLTPEDFGVMTAAMMVIAFSQIFWDAGMGKALIQRRTDINEAANAAFWINIGLAVIIALLLYFFSSAIAHSFFRDDRVTAVLRVMTLQVLLGALSSIQNALLQKEMGFKKLFWVRFSTIVLPGIASIPLAWYGFGYWALVAGTLGGQLAQVGMLWYSSNWRPTLTINRRITREMSHFGGWVSVTGLLTWFYAWADSFVVGHYLGSQDLGIFRTGSQFTIFVFALLFGPIAPVLYSQLARFGYDKERIRQVAQISLRALTATAVPTAMLIFAFSNYIEVLIFGSKWAGIGLIIGIMALMQGFSWIVGMNGEFYRAIGKPSYETIITAGLVVIYIIAYLVTIQYGLEVFVWARLLLALGALLLHIGLAGKLMNINIRDILGRIAIITIISFTTAWSSKISATLLLDRAILEFIAGITVASLVIAFFIFMLERRSTVPAILSYIRKE